MKSFLFTAFFCVVSIAISAQNSHSVLKKGDESYLKGEFAEAQKHYEVAYSQKDKPAQSAFNLGNTYFMQAKSANPEMYKNAVNYFEQAAAAAKDKKERADAHYNRGNAILQQSSGNNLMGATNPASFADAIEAYKETLRLNPNDKEARHNLAYALQKKKKQEQEQKKEEDKKDKNQKNDPKEDEKNKDKQNDSNKNGNDKKDEKEQQQQQNQAQKGNPKKAETERLMQLIQNEEQNTRKKMLQQQMPQPAPNGKSW